MDPSKIMATPTGRACFPHLQGASQCAARGDWAQAAAEYRHIVKKSQSDVGFALRSWGLNGFTAILVDQQQGQATEADFTLLKRIAKGKYGDAVHLRAEARKSLGLLCWNKYDRSKAAKHYRKCIALCSAATEADRCIPVFMGTSYMPASSYLDLCRRMCQDNLQVLERGHASPAEAKAFAEANLAEARQLSKQLGLPTSGSGARLNALLSNPADSVHTTFVPAEHSALLEYNQRAAAGAACRVCAAPRAAAGGPALVRTLKRCGQCLRARYCSKECAKADWRNGHKAACRRAGGPFQEGDLAVLQGLKSRPELNGMMVTLMQSGGGEADASGTPRWRANVLLPAGLPCQVLRVKADNMLYMMPLPA